MNVRTLLLAPAEQRSRAAHVSLFWSEKLWSLLIYFQHFALLFGSLLLRANEDEIENHHQQNHWQESHHRVLLGTPLSG